MVRDMFVSTRAYVTFCPKWIQENRALAEAIDRIEKMSAEIERSMATRSSSFYVAARFCAGKPRFRSGTLWICGLAIVVALCAFSYKLKQYTTRLDPATRLSFVKLWDKHQDVAQLTSALKTSAQSYPQSPLQGTIALPKIFAVKPSSEGELTECRPMSTLWPLLPLRSPPPQTN